MNVASVAAFHLFDSVKEDKATSFWYMENIPGYSHLFMIEGITIVKFDLIQGLGSRTKSFIDLYIVLEMVCGRITRCLRIP